MYMVVITIFIDDYYLIFLFLQGIYIIGAALDISWFYAGTEKFKIPSLVILLRLVLYSMFMLSVAQR